MAWSFSGTFLDGHQGDRMVACPGDTFGAAADCLDAGEDLSFAASSAAYYQWVQESDPVLFERIRQHAAAGRSELVGGEWVEPDCHLPAGESVCRQLLYGQRYFHQAFGVTATVAYNIDSSAFSLVFAAVPVIFYVVLSKRGGGVSIFSGAVKG